MRAVVQRVSEASVSVSGQVISDIKQGFLVLLGVNEDDTEEDMKWVAKKIAGMRIFTDSEGKMNLNLEQVEGDILLVSQFTLYADTKRGNRPGFSRAASFDLGNELYEATAAELRNYGLTVKTGKYGADMQVLLVNDGPVTIILDSLERV